FGKDLRLNLWDPIRKSRKFKGMSRKEIMSYMCSLLRSGDNIVKTLLRTCLAESNITYSWNRVFWPAIHNDLAVHQERLALQRHWSGRTEGQ
nr:hypothetical protein [Tanacetum cinerariifolium]